MEALDALTNATTAMSTWNQLKQAMSGGYVPTVYPDSRRKRLLIRVIKAHGFRVWPNR